MKALLCVALLLVAVPALAVPDDPYSSPATPVARNDSTSNVLPLR